jgi:diguanylate cyclase (GGDEF)-like protein/PAS domain S-box-containing protein
VGSRKANLGLDQIAERYAMVGRATKDLVWDWDFETGSVTWNEALDRDWIDEPAAGDRVTSSGWWEERVHPEDRERTLEKIEQAVRTGGRFESEYRFRRADGSYADIFDRGFVISDSRGKPARMVGAMQDNTEIRRAAAALQDRERQLATILGQAMVGIMHFGSDGRPLIVNQRFCEILGRTEEELKTLSFTDYTHPDDLARNLALWEESHSRAEPFQMEKRYLRPDGSSVWCAVHVSFVGEPANVTGSIVVAEDITARRLAEEEAERDKALLQSVVDSVSDLIFVKDGDGRFVLTNRALDEGCGVLTGRHTSELFEEDLVEGYESLDAEVMRTGEPREVEEIIPIRGERLLFETVKVPWIQDGKPVGIIGVSRDITERKQVEVALRESELLYRSVLQASADCIKIIALDGTIELINEPGACTLELASAEDIKGKVWTALWPPESQAAVTKAVDQALAGKVARFSGFCPTALGTPKWWDVVVSPMRDADGKVCRLLSISRDITRSRETAEELRWASEHDALTTLPNRRTFQAHLQAATIRAMESGGMVGLLLMDLDHFKHVNDTLGHAAGDTLLATFGQRLKSTVRATDFVARLGGDEFAVILEGVSDEEDLVRAGTSILARAGVPIRIDGRALSTSASIGGALFPRDAATAQELFNNADTALYALKQAGRGGTRMFHNHMREQAQKIASQLGLARFALSERSVVPHYQSKVELASGRVLGFEALLRWQHPRQGIQPPDTIAEAFKDYELASRIGELMQTRVMRDIRRWQEAGLDVGRVSINAAPAEFMRDDYAERLLRNLKESGISPCCIEIEVTEHVFLDRASDYVGRALETLNKAGVLIALDDFGTGYSSLSHLRDFPVDVVKIDRSFIERMTDEPEIAAIVSAVIDLGRSLSMMVVAEGVEREEQRALLAARGCTLGQGYLFGRAAPADEIAALLRITRGCLNRSSRRPVGTLRMRRSDETRPGLPFTRGLSGQEMGRSP